MSERNGGAERRLETVEADSIRAGRFLIEKGFDLAEINGLAEGYTLEDRSGIGVLKRKSLSDPSGRRVWIGNVWVSNAARKADSSRWVFDVYGRDNIESIVSVSEEMIEAFQVDINCRIVTENNKYETLRRDLEVHI